jgi:hypothetical protein
MLSTALHGAQVLGMHALKPYNPDFKTAIAHFLIHPGGKAVIGEVAPHTSHAPFRPVPLYAPAT